MKPHHGHHPHKGLHSEDISWTRIDQANNQLTQSTTHKYLGKLQEQQLLNQRIQRSFRRHSVRPPHGRQTLMKANKIPCLLRSTAGTRLRQAPRSAIYMPAARKSAGATSCWRLTSCGSRTAAAGRSNSGCLKHRRTIACNGVYMLPRKNGLFSLSVRKPWWPIWPAAAPMAASSAAMAAPRSGWRGPSTSCSRNYLVLKDVKLR